MNILLLSMSKLSVREGIIEDSKCKWTDENNTEHEIEYYSQLEPITRMLIEAGEIPDEVIMLCTRESVEQVSFMLKDEDKVPSRSKITAFASGHIGFWKSPFRSPFPKKRPAQTCDCRDRRICSEKEKRGWRFESLD